MATKDAVTIGDEIQYARIEPDGAEVPLAGLVWAPAAPLSGMKAFWVLDEQRTPVLVVRASRRHQVGRQVATTRRGMDGALVHGTAYVEKAGRFVDVGEWFTETDPRSRFNRTHRPPRRLAPRKRVDAGSQTEMLMYVALCERAAAGENVDLTVDAHSVGEAADLANVEEEE